MASINFPLPTGRVSYMNAMLLLGHLKNSRRFGLSQFGKSPRPQHRDQQSARASQNHCRHGAKPVCRDSRFELSQFVRSSDEHHPHGIDASRISSGVFSCTSVPRVTTLTISVAPTNKSDASE